MEKKNIRILFILIFILMFAQFFFAYMVGEPYPAIIMPAFSSIPQVENYVSYIAPNITIIFVDASSISLPYHDFIDFAGPATKTRIMRENFYPGGYPKGKSVIPIVYKELLIGFVNKTFPDVLRRYYRINVVDSSTKDWIKSRLTDITGRTDFVSIRVDWHGYKKSITNGSVEKNLLTNVTINLQ